MRLRQLQSVQRIGRSEMAPRPPHDFRFLPMTTREILYKRIGPEPIATASILPMDYGAPSEVAR